ncbi:MAG: hypothetical protein LUE89_00085 [Clostridiales bacterium]|nr:hypothetical protein [Clostridiales bacterium]
MDKENDLKLALFRQTKEALDAFRKADAKPAESYDDYIKRKTTHATFHALYSLIEAANLEDEYQAWKEELQ